MSVIEQEETKSAIATNERRPFAVAFSRPTVTEIDNANVKEF